MNPMMMAAMMILAVLASCSRSASDGGAGEASSGATASATGAIGALKKVEGPPMDRLSRLQIEDIVQTCFLHHDLDDARVPYTRGYCEKVFSERDRRSMRAPGTPKANAANEAVDLLR